MKNVGRQITYLISFLFVIMMTMHVYAGPGFTTYQAKIIKPDGNPLEASSVNFKFTILNPLGTCVLFSETYSAMNMNSSGGLISFSLGSGLKTYPLSGTTFAEVFSNITPNLSCDVGGPVSYSPGPNDTRLIVMQFNDGQGWQTLPAMNINAVPYAMFANDAQHLGGVSATAFVQRDEFDSCSAGEAVFYNGSNFSCVPVGGGGGVTSATIVSALGYTPANGASITAVNSDVSNLSTYASNVSSTVFSVASTVSGLSNSVTSLQTSVAASFAALVPSPWTTSGTSVFYTGPVGVNGITTPATALDVSGGLRIGTENAACSSGLAGTLRYNSGVVEYCNGTIWSAFGVSGAGILALNGLTSGSQTFAFGSSGNSPNISSTGSLHTFNFPLASVGTTTAGVISNSDYSLFSTVVSKISSSAASLVQVLGFTPADQATVTTLSSTVGSVSSAVNTLSNQVSSVSAAIQSVQTTANSKITSSAASIAQVLGYTPAASGGISSQWATSGTTINYTNGFVGVGTANPSAILDINSTTSGFLMPRLTTVQRNAIASPVNGLMVYDTDLKGLFVYAVNVWKQVGGSTHEFRASQVSGSTTYANATFTDVVYTSEEYDVSNAYNNATGTYTIPEDGTYFFSWAVYLNNASKISIRYTELWVDGATKARSSEAITSGFNEGAIQGSAVIRLSAGQVVKIRTFQSSSDASAAPANANSLPQVWNFAGARIGGSGGQSSSDNLGNHLATQNINLSNYQLVGNGGSTGISITSSGAVGIGNLNPVTALDINGAIKLSMQVLTCAASYAGALRYNGGNVEYCNGTAWTTFGEAGAGLANFNGSTSATQSFAISTATGTGPSFSTVNGVHTLNIPLASVGTATAGLISNSDYLNFSNKVSSQWNTSGTTINYMAGNVGIGTSTPSLALVVSGNGHFYSSSLSTYSSSSTTTTTPVSGNRMLSLQNTSTTNDNASFLTFSNVVADTTSRGSYIGLVETSSGGGNWGAFVFGGRSGSSAYQERMRINLTNGYVGMGSTPPRQALDVAPAAGLSVIRATSTNSTAALQLYRNTAGAYAGPVLWSNGASLNFGYDSSENAGPTLMTLETNGNLGIGTTSPSNALDIQRATGSDAVIALTNASPGVGAYITAIANSNFSAFTSMGTSQTWVAGQYGSRSYIIGDLTNGVIPFTIASNAPSSSFVMNASGSIGVKNPTPTAHLHLAAGTASMAPLKLTSGVLLTSPQPGSIEYDGFNFYTTNGAGSRSAIGSGGGGSGVATFNGSTSSTQTLAAGATGTAPSFTTVNGVHTLNIPYASVGTTTAGLISNADYVNFNNKVSSQWTTSGTQIFYNTGNVGINVNSAAIQSRLQIHGDSSYSGSGGGQIRIAGSANHNQRLDIGYNTSSNQGFLQAAYNGGMVQSFSINPDGGHVGIGVSAPVVAAHIINNGASNEGLRVERATGTSPSFGQFRNGVGRFNVGVEGSVSNTVFTGSTQYAGFIDANNRDLFLASGNTAKITLKSTGDVGIGTSAPTVALDIYRTNVDTELAIRTPSQVYNPMISLSNGVNTFRQLLASGEFRITDAGYANLYKVTSQSVHTFYSAANSPKMTVDFNGVGIGTQTPQYDLSVYDGSTNAIVNVESGNTGSAAYTRYFSRETGGVSRTYFVGMNISNSSAGYEIYDATSGTSRLMVNKLGYVGINTDSPSFPLDIQTTGSFTARYHHSSNNANDGAAIMMTRTRGTLSSYAGVQAQDTIGGYYFRAHDGTDPYTTTAAIEVNAAVTHTPSNRGTYMVFKTTVSGSSSIAERARIDSGGNFIIAPNVGSTTSNYLGYVGSYSSTAGQAQWAGNWVGSGYWGIGPNTNVADNTIRIGNMTATGAWNGTQNLNLVVGGRLGVGGVSASTYAVEVNGSVQIVSGSALRIGSNAICTTAGCTAVSDVRLKENIKPLDFSLEKILSLKGVQYDFKDKGTYGEKHQVGFIAQELEKVYPEVVHTDKDSGVKTVSYQHLVAPLIEAIKTMYAKHSRSIASLEENDSLKDQQIKALQLENDRKDKELHEMKERLDRIEKALQQK